MNGRVFILFAAWIAVGVAFYLSHPIGYAVILIGLAASVAIAEENLLDGSPAERPGEFARTPVFGPSRKQAAAVRVSRVPSAGHAPHRERLPSPSTALS